MNLRRLRKNYKHMKKQLIILSILTGNFSLSAQNTPELHLF